MFLKQLPFPSLILTFLQKGVYIAHYLQIALVVEFPLRVDTKLSAHCRSIIKSIGIHSSKVVWLVCDK